MEEGKSILGGGLLFHLQVRRTVKKKGGRQVIRDPQATLSDSLKS